MGNRRRQRGIDRAVLDAGEERRWCTSHPAGVLPALRRGWACVRVRAELCRPLRRARNTGQESPGSGHAPGRVCARPQLFDSDRDHAGRAVRLLVMGGRGASSRVDRRAGACDDTGRSRGAFPRVAGIHREARLPAVSELPRGIPRRRLRGYDNPHSYSAWSSAGAAADAERVLRPHLDVGQLDLRRLAVLGRRPLHRTLHPARRRTPCSSSATRSIRRRVTRER